MKLTAVQKEFFRKFIHLLELPVVAGYSFLRFYFNEKVAVLALTALLLLLIEIEYVRLEYRPSIPKIFRVMLRRKEHRNVTSMIFFISSTIIAFSAFDYSIALLALLYTVFGDMVAALVGMKFGQKKLFRQKTFAGFLAGLLTNFVVGFFIYWFMVTHQGLASVAMFPPIFVVMAVTASVVELLTNKLDDNLTVPLFAGFIGQMLAFVMGLPVFR